MSQISSINFKKSFAINAKHNDRTLPPSYLIDNEKGAQCNRSAKKARELKEQIISEAKETYQNSKSFIGMSKIRAFDSKSLGKSRRMERKGGKISR